MNKRFLPSNVRHCLRVEARTWCRDSHDLYDYESKAIDLKRFNLTTNSRFYRSGAEIFCQEFNTFKDTIEYLLSVKSQQYGAFQISPAEKFHHRQNENVIPKKLWIVVKDYCDNNYPIKENDVIKLGRFKLRVKQICTTESIDQSIHIGENNDKNVKFPDNK